MNSMIDCPCSPRCDGDNQIDINPEGHFVVAGICKFKQTEDVKNV